MPNLKGLLHTVMAVIVLAAIASLLTHNTPSTAQTATTTSTAPVRHFYLTKARTFDGSHALTACATGYHPASIWEIHEPSALSYNKTLGLTFPDSGAGPPTESQGWVRTGLPGEVANQAGVANCNVWTSNSSSDYGTRVQLGVTALVPPEVVSPWDEFTQPCSLAGPVWCVKN